MYLDTGHIVDVAVHLEQLASDIEQGRIKGRKRVRYSRLRTMVGRVSREPTESSWDVSTMIDDYTDCVTQRPPIILEARS